MRIGLIHYGLDRHGSGIARYTTELAASLRARGADVFPLWAGSRKLDPSGAILRGSYRLPGLLTMGQIEIAQAVRQHHLDVVHDPTGTCPLMLTRAPRVVTIHDAIPYVYPELSTALDRLVYRYWLPVAIRSVNAIITDSDSSLVDISTHLPISPEAIAVIPIAASDRFRPLEKSTVTPALRAYGLPESYILYVGAIESRKNLVRLLRAYSLLRTAPTCPKLVIVGGHKQHYAEVSETAQHLNLQSEVVFAGYVADEDLPAIYAGAELFVFPSLYEGFGLPILEAMASGTPVVTSATSSIPAVAGDAAILVDPTDTSALAHAMRRVLNEPELATSLRSKGLRQAATFSWGRTAKETMDVYERAIAVWSGD